MIDNNLKVEFEYRDEFSRGRWCRQGCTGYTVAETIELYGLGRDCEYRILSVNGEKVAEPHGEGE